MKANLRIKFVKLGLLLFFIFPMVALVIYFSLNFQFNTHEIFWALKNSLLQSFFTAVISVMFGYCAALGLLTLPEKIKNIVKFMSFIPVFLPSLFSVLIGLSLLPMFPMGSIGVIFITSLIYMGFAAAMLCEVISDQLGRLGFVSEIYNIKKVTFLRKILFPMTSKAAYGIFAVIFVSVLTSFTVPLLVGGGRGTNFEVLIYEKVFIDQNWSLAIGLSLLQMCFIFIFSNVIKATSTLGVNDFYPTKLTASKVGLAVLCAYLFVYTSGYFKLLTSAFQIYYMSEIFNFDMILAVKESLVFYFLTMVMFFGVLTLVIFLKFHFQKIKFLNMFLTPSSVLMGFSLYLLFPHNNINLDYVKMAWLITIISFLSIYKMTAESRLDQFEKQMFVARINGLSFFKFLMKILIPQTKKMIFYICSLVFVFCISEFALIKTSGAQIKTLGVMMAAYLSSYRIEGAFVISLVILTLWFIFSLILGASLGLHKKS